MSRRIKGIIDFVAETLKNPKYDREEFDPRFYPAGTVRVKDAPEYRPNVIDTGTMIPQERIALQDLEGRPYLTTMSDRTAAGGILEGIGNKPIAHPIRLTGGQDYMRDDTGELWASGEGVVPNIVKAASELQDQYGSSPVYMPWRMAPSGGDFAHMTGQTMLSWASANMPKGVKKQLDSEMKLFVPDWAGVDDPKSLAQYGSLPDKQRKQAMNMMDKNFRNQGGISQTQARLAVADQSQLLSPVSGFQNVGEIDLQRGVLERGGNPTYPSGLAGEYSGTLDTDVTAMDLNPERFARARKKDGSFDSGPQGPDYLSTKDAPRRSMEVNYYGGLIDEPLLRRLSDEGFKINSGLLPGIVTAGVAGASLLGSEEADASFVGVFSKLGASRADLKGMATKMEAEGLSPKEIIEKTGWYKGAQDGKWRTELPNTNTKINLPDVDFAKTDETQIVKRLDEIVDDPELLSQYDVDVQDVDSGFNLGEADFADAESRYGFRSVGELGKTRVVFDSELPPGEGYFDGSTITVSALSSPQEQRATILHELQHVIQKRENFAEGANAKLFENDKFYSDLWTESAEKTLEKLDEAYLEKDEYGFSTLSGEDREKRDLLRLAKMKADRFRAESAKAGTENPFNMYLASTGEVEARNVELRDRAMSPTGLRAVAPFETESVPSSNQIFRPEDDPVTSFEDVVDTRYNSYRQPNARATEKSRFESLMREDERLREMGSASWGKVSPELAAYRRSQILPSIAEMGMGALDSAVDTIDFLSQIPSSRYTGRMSESTPLRDSLGGLLDYNFMDERDRKAIEEARLIGSLLGPI